jgi:hypothetical protein
MNKFKTATSNKNGHANFRAGEIAALLGYNDAPPLRRTDIS